MREIREELQPILIQWLPTDNWKCGASGTQESKGEPQEQIVCFSCTSGESRGKQWNLYFRTAWKLNSNSAFVAQVSPKPICLGKELKRCYKTYIFLNKGWPRLSTPVSNCIWWNCAPADGIPRSGGGTREAEHHQLSTSRAAFAVDHNTQLCFQHPLGSEKCDVLQREEAPWLWHCSSTGSDLMGREGRGRGVCRSPAWCEC